MANVIILCRKNIKTLNKRNENERGKEEQREMGRAQRGDFILF